MIAGAAESLSGLTGLSTILLGAIVTLVIFVLALCGLQSLVASFSALVPVITVCAVIIAVVVFRREGTDGRICAGGIAAASELVCERGDVCGV